MFVAYQSIDGLVVCYFVGKGNTQNPQTLKLFPPRSIMISQ